MYTYVEQNHLIDKTLKERLDGVGQIMKEEGIDGWLILSKEYNEDIIFPFVTPAYYPTARRITILLLTQEKNYSLSLPDHDLEKYYEPAFVYKKEDQFEALEKLLRKLDLKKIAIDRSTFTTFADGLSSGLYQILMEKLPGDITERFVPADNLAIRYLETRTDTELEIYPDVMKVAMDVIDEAFSDSVITPGKTTCRDVMDFMDTKVNSLGLSCWFPSTVNLQRKGGAYLEEDTVIEKGDMLHCDFGITYCGLCTDTQRLCYVLKDDETELPEGLKAAMKRNNRFQDIVRETMVAGKSGNDIFVESVARGKEEGLRPILYTHSLGHHGHAAGPMFGLYSNQNPIPGIGDLILHDRTSFALELTTVEYVPEFESDLRMQTEESIVFVDGKASFLAEGREIIKTIRGGQN